MRSGTKSSSRDKGRGQRASEGSSRGMGGGHTTAENSRTPPVRVERGRGRGARAPDARRHTLLHTQPQEDMDDISRYAFVTVRRETLRITTSLFCQERWASSRTIPGYGPPPTAAAQEGQPEGVPTEQERPSPSELISAGQAPPTPKTKARSTTARQLQLDDLPSPPEQDTGIVHHQHNADDPWPPVQAGSFSNAGLGTDGPVFLGPRNENPDQCTRDPSANQGELPSQELEANTIPTSNIVSLGQESVHTTENSLLTPPEASIDPPTQTGRDSTSTLPDNHARGSSGTIGHTTDRSDKGLSKKDSTRPKSKNRKALPLQEGRSMIFAPYTALDQSTSPAGIDEWPQLPGQGAQDLDGPSPEPTAMPRASSVVSPTTIQPPEQRLQETVTGSTDQVMFSSDETNTDQHVTPEPITSVTTINAPDAKATETYTVARSPHKAVRSKRFPQSSTACFSFDTPVLMEPMGTAFWKKDL